MDLRYLGRIMDRDPANLLFLCGAGVSYNAPTKLPTVNRFIFEALKQCQADSGIIKAVKTKTESQDAQSRFEVFVDELRKLRDPSLRIAKVFDSQNYNTIHHFLGEMLIRGAAVLTTNFDNCIENSVSANSYRRIVFEGEDLRSEEPFTGTLVKIHGSNPFPYQNSQSPLLITIKALATTAQGFARFPGWRSYLGALLRDRMVIVLGYSGSDDFDINPVLLKSKPRQVHWFDFDERNHIPTKTTPISNDRVRLLSARLPISYYTGRLEGLIESWARAVSITLRKSHGKSTSWNIEYYVNKLYPRLEHKSALINEILLNYGLYDLVALRETTGKSTTVTIQKIKALYRLGKSQDASGMITRNVKRFKRPTDQLQALYFQSASLYQLGRLTEAVEVSERQCRLAKTLGDNVAVIQSLNNLGGLCFAVGNLSRARSRYNASLKRQEKGASIEGGATALWGLGDIASVTGHYREAYDLYVRAREVYVELGHSYNLTWIDHNIGVALTGLRRFSQAERFLSAALKSFKQSHHAAGTLFTLNSLGKLHYHRKRVGLARRMFEEGMEVLQQNNGLPGGVESALLLVLVTSKTERSFGALRAKDDSLIRAIASKTEDRNGKLLKRFLLSPKSKSILRLIETRFLK